MNPLPRFFNDGFTTYRDSGQSCSGLTPYSGGGVYHVGADFVGDVEGLDRGSPPPGMEGFWGRV